MGDDPPIESRLTIRPGPDAIAPRGAPGGLVLHVYEVPTQLLLLTRPLRTLAEAEESAFTDAELVELLTSSREVCIVAYDGDTGERVRLRGGRADDPRSREPR